jgi:hypothetical protein
VPRSKIFNILTAFEHIKNNKTAIGWHDASVLPSFADKFGVGQDQDLQQDEMIAVCSQVHALHLSSSPSAAQSFGKIMCHLPDVAKFGGSRKSILTANLHCVGHPTASKLRSK